MPPRKILVVDDEYAFAEFAKLMLESMGYQAVVALQAKEGLLLAVSEKPDAILMDIAIPDMPGPEAARRLKADPATRAIPIILCSTSERGDEIARECGAIGFLRKPIKLEHFKALLQRAQEATP